MSKTRDDAEYIAENLKRAYRKALEEKTPERFTELLEKLR